MIDQDTLNNIFANDTCVIKKSTISNTKYGSEVEDSTIVYDGRCNFQQGGYILMRFERLSIDAEGVVFLDNTEGVFVGQSIVINGDIEGNIERVNKLSSNVYIKLK